MRIRSSIVAMIMPALLLAAVFTLALFAVLLKSVTGRDGGLTLTWLRAFLGDGHNLSILAVSVRISLYVTVACLLLGYPIALTISRGPKLVSRLAMLALAIQFFSIYIVKMYGWMLVLGNTGIVNRLLVASGLTHGPVRLMYNELGTAIGLFAAALPLMVFPINASLEMQDRSLEEAAGGLGAGRMRVLWEVTLPLSLPGVVSGCALAFLFCFTAYLTPALLGGGYFRMIGNVIFEQAVSRFNYANASTAAVVTFIISIVVVVLVDRLGRLRNRRAA